MTPIEFTIPVIPVAQGRPRFFRRGSYVSTYDPARSKAHKELIAMCAKSKIDRPLKGPVIIAIVFLFPRPQTLTKKSSPQGIIPHIKRPDGDNLIKAILDGMNGIAYKDDSQVFDISAKKYYCAIGREPETLVSIHTPEQ